ncbi:MAG TPA: TonB family protein [Pyrinomonadaceae bacterium]|jgi:TonB family protein|nr:TonB family protein [Pyrinomonadaceae bacterium]
MRRTLAAVVLSLAASGAVWAQQAGTQTNAEAARAELRAGTRAYGAGDYAAAERHFRKVLELDPTVKDVRLYIARSVQRQYRPGVQTPENVAAGERAVAAYEDILGQEPLNEDAFKAVLGLYGQMKNEEKVREVLLRRAETDALPPERRAEAYTVLAGKQWQCSYDITERKENKETAQEAEKVVVKYKMPPDSSDFYRARECANEGLRLAELAVGLDANSTPAQSYRMNLLREAAKLAEMEGDAAGAAEYMRQHAAAQQAVNAMRGAPGEKAEGGGAAQRSPDSPDAPQPAPGSKPKMVSGGILNGKAVSKPAPEYPEEARAAGVEGTVTVKILVDEEGKVVTAEAVSGPELLRPAAEAAARLARLSPTRLSGEPVRVSGLLTYNFVLR